MTVEARRCAVCTTAAKSQVLDTAVSGAPNAFWPVGLEALFGCVATMAEGRSQETWDCGAREKNSAPRPHYYFSNVMVYGEVSLIGRPSISVFAEKASLRNLKLSLSPTDD